jgi:IS1 family transposase
MSAIGQKNKLLSERAELSTNFQQKSELSTGFQQSDVEPKGVYEIDELYWFVNKKAKTETRENMYLIAILDRDKRQLAGFAVSEDKSAETIQSLVDSVPKAEKYCTDGYIAYTDVNFRPGRHIRNVRDKKDTHNIESVNADFRHYIPVLARRSRCFPRSLESLTAVLTVFADAFNKFGIAKAQHRAKKPMGDLPFGLVDFL